MKKERNVIYLYTLCNKLKNVIRTGWKDWSVAAPRLESIAEHIYGTQMLAIAIYSEYDYDINIFKVIYLLAIHEIGETIIGDFTPFQINKKEKEKLEHEAVHKLLEPLLNRDEIENLFLEFDSHLTKESIFAYQCDKLECDLQCKLYDEKGYVDINDSKTRKNIDPKELERIKKNNVSWSSSWINYDLQSIDYDENFIKIAKYALNNKIDLTEE